MSCHKTELHTSIIELLPGCRLVMGPSPSAKRNNSVKSLIHDFGINCFVNLTPKHGASRWYMPNNNILDKLRVNEEDEIMCLSHPMSTETPEKDKTLLRFITRLCQIMKYRKDLKMYIHDYSGTYVAASVALPLAYFLKSTAEKQVYDPVQEMKRRGKHHVVSDRNKPYIDQIRRMCVLDKKSIHRHIFQTKKRKKPE